MRSDCNDPWLADALLMRLVSRPLSYAEVLPPNSTLASEMGVDQITLERTFDYLVTFRFARIEKTESPLTGIYHPTQKGFFVSRHVKTHGFKTTSRKAGNKKGWQLFRFYIILVVTVIGTVFTILQWHEADVERKIKEAASKSTRQLQDSQRNTPPTLSPNSGYRKQPIDSTQRPIAPRLQ